LPDFEATGIKRSSGAAVFQLQLAVIEISAGVSRRSAQKVANRMELDTLCNCQAATAAAKRLRLRVPACSGVFPPTISPVHRK
jgi:hypothetical protein